MSDCKKYYYLKLKDNFFESDSMILLESLPDGYLYSNILLKLYLKSLKYNGRLALNGRIPFSTKMLADVTRHSVETVEKAIEAFKEFGLIEILDNGVIYMTEIQNYIGKSSTEADRIREYRNQIKAEKEDVQMYGQMYDICTPEIETEKETELEIEKYSFFSPPEGETHKKKKKPPETESKGFVPPSVEAVKQLCRDKGYLMDPEEFIAYHTSRGWKNITDWEAAADYWESGRKKKLAASGNTPRADPGNTGNRFINFRQRENDYNEIQKRLVRNSLK